jgi:acetolactate synthase-1/2/3 large subunit
VELLSGGEMVARALEDEGVEFIFGYPGGTVLHIYDALFKDCKVPHVLVRHELMLLPESQRPTWTPFLW